MLKSLLRNHKVDQAGTFHACFDNIRYINCVFVLIRTGRCCNFFLFLCLHLANIQVSVCRTTGPLIYIKVGCFKRGMNYKDVIMMGKLALRLCLISYYRFDSMGGRF